MYYYCVNHRTTKTSEKIDIKGNKKRINICDCRIHYAKNRDIYLFLKDHSKECYNLVKEIPINILEVNKEISNYQKFRNFLKEYLGKNPNINFNDFRKEGDKLYTEKNYQFSLGENFYSNIYYNWRKLSNAFNKFSIFENQKTLDDKQLLRDFTVTILYNKNNNTTFQHEHIIYISDYFIKKLNKAEHLYIDGTFIYPQDFKQLIVILYLDENINKRMPGLFALINNKKERGYYCLFKKIYEIISIEETSSIKLKSYTVDFEIGLINALKQIFKNAKPIGCFFHYTRAIRKKCQELGLLSKSESEGVKDLLKEFYLAPFSYYKDKNKINSICERYSENNEKFSKFIDYFKNQWFRFYENGMLDYSLIKKSQRSNSYIENYNRKIKLKLSKYLFGKNKCKITWPLFHLFIREEESETKKEIFNLENQLPKKLNKIIKIDTNFETQNDKQNIIDNKDILIKENIFRRNWLKFNEYSCRHDSFFSYIVLFYILG